MSRHTDLRVKNEAIRLREVERLHLKDIAAKVGRSMATVCRWLQPYPLTAEEMRQFRGSIARHTMTGRKHSSETIRKRVENSREKIRASALARFGGAWTKAKANGNTTYVSRVSCKKRHFERYVASKMCVQCQS